jgi:hypothetical protein
MDIGHLGEAMFVLSVFNVNVATGLGQSLCPLSSVEAEGSNAVLLQITYPLVIACLVALQAHLIGSIAYHGFQSGWQIVWSGDLWNGPTGAWTGGIALEEEAWNEKVTV